MATASLLVTINDALVKEAMIFAGAAKVLFFRGLFAVAPILVYAWLWKRPEILLPHNIRLALLLSVLAVLSLFLFTVSLRHIPLAAAVVLVYLSPILGAVIIAFRDILIRASFACERAMALVVWTHLPTIGVAALSFGAAWLRSDMRQFGLYVTAGITVSLDTAGMIAALRYASAASM